jgi:hypothetical protein
VVVSTERRTDKVRRAIDALIRKCTESEIDNAVYLGITHIERQE